jgi:hypothetical protein
MFREISYALIFGRPLIMYLGLLTLLSLLTTATVGYLVHKGKVPFKWHVRSVAVTLTLAIIHGTLGVLAYL